MSENYKEKPILFSTSMVQAILEKRKTQTRRVIRNADITNNFDIDVDGSVYAYCCPATGDHFEPWEIAPWKNGEILWVRETWTPCATIDSWLDDVNLYAYKADYAGQEVPWKWRPSIHMPKTAARIWLRVTDVRVERLQEITEDDALAEGIDWMDDACWDNGWSPTLNDPDSGGEPLLRAGYASLWDSINAKRGFGWDANPWVWVIEFESLEGKPCLL